MDNINVTSKFSNCIFHINYLSEEKSNEYASDFNYREFVNNIVNLGEEFVSAIKQIYIKPNGDNIMEILCGIAPMWKEHESKESFEKYYIVSEMMRSLYANEYEENGEPVSIYVKIDNKKLIVNWKYTQKEIEDKDKMFPNPEDMFDDTFAYREATIEECGILELLEKNISTKSNNTSDDNLYKMISSSDFIMIYDENISLKQFKEVYQRMAYLGYAQQNVKFNVEI